MVLPTHSSQWPQPLKQPCTISHGWHLVGSSLSASVQVGLPFLSTEPRKTPLVPPASAVPPITQQPKQSQPFGVSGPHTVWQAWLWFMYSPSQVAPFGKLVFGS